MGLAHHVLVVTEIQLMVGGAGKADAGSPTLALYLLPGTCEDDRNKKGGEILLSSRSLELSFQCDLWKEGNPVN